MGEVYSRGKAAAIKGNESEYFSFFLHSLIVIPALYQRVLWRSASAYLQLGVHPRWATSPSDFKDLQREYFLHRCVHQAESQSNVPN